MQDQAAVELTAQQIAPLLLLPQILILCVGLIVAQVFSGMARLKVGPVIAADRRVANRVRFVMTVLVLGIFAWIALDRAVWLTPVILCLGSALLLVYTTPSSKTAVLGEGGVQRGWHARRFESLEEWRLTGDHLRFRLFGEWTSVPCPPDRQADLRAKLVQLVPDRESPFQD
ncbi:MAG: hypothetical protein NTY35_06195 [Planctomycetota bacterium]|nr:hypothetical protein [Planctomycetota bacterium]